MEQIDLQLTKQKVRYPVYEWVHNWPQKWVENTNGKFEQFLSGYRKLRNGWKDGQTTFNDFDNDKIRSTIAKRIATLHSAEVTDIDKLRYRSKDYERIWWNTFEVKKHFGMVKIKLTSIFTAGGALELISIFWPLVEIIALLSSILNL